MVWFWSHEWQVMAKTRVIRRVTPQASITVTVSPVTLPDLINNSALECTGDLQSVVNPTVMNKHPIMFICIHARSIIINLFNSQILVDNYTWTMINLLIRTAIARDFLVSMAMTCVIPLIPVTLMNQRLSWAMKRKNTFTMLIDRPTKRQATCNFGLFLSVYIWQHAHKILVHNEIITLSFILRRISYVIRML